MALIEQRRDYTMSSAPGAQVDLDALPLVKAAIDRGQVRRGDIERVVKLMKPEMLDEMADAARSFQSVAPVRDLAADEDVAREFGLDPEEVRDVLLGPRELRYEEGDAADLTERKQIAREYGMRLDEVV